MTCRHGPGDPNCSSHPDNVRAREYAYAQRQSLAKAQAETTPDADNYEILDAVQFPNALVLKVRYPSCKKCAFEGTKVLVYKKVKSLDALRWKRIDPHFADDSKMRSYQEAPSPLARFSGSPQGWALALKFAGLLTDEGDLVGLPLI